MPPPAPQLLEDPDAEPARPLKLVPLKRYAAALAADKRAKEAAAAREALVVRLRAAVQGTALSALYRQAIGLAPVAAGAQAGAQAAAQPEEKPTAAAAGLPGSLPTVATLTLQGPIYLGPGPATPFNPLVARNPQQVGGGGGGLRNRPDPALRPAACRPRPLLAAPRKHRPCCPPPPPALTLLARHPQKVASLDVIRALRAAREDKAVKAVVLRIDSPGERPRAIAGCRFCGSECGGLLNLCAPQPAGCPVPALALPPR